MKTYEENYSILLSHVLTTGQARPSRVGNTISVFGAHLAIPDLREGHFPLLTTRRMFVQGQLGELAAFLRGADDVATFQKFGCKFWNANAAAWTENVLRPPEKHKVGRVYGVQWRDWNYTYDQLSVLVNGIKSDPYGRRHILTTWNPSELNRMCLPPCHILAQFYVDVDGYLDCMVYMRSVDLCLGLPSDVVLYAALLCLVAKETGYKPGTLKFSFGDAHIYEAHVPQLKKQLCRLPNTRPTYELEPTTRLFNFQPDDFTFSDYFPHERIDYELLV